MTDLFLRIITHLLPNARAWRITIDKTLRQFFEGLATSTSVFKEYFDLVWLDIFPQTTRELNAWERQFGLSGVGLTEQVRRDRLDAAWKALGGQSPRYIQDTLRAAGFDVYVHEWWAPGTEPPIGVKECTTPRNPTLYLRREFTGAQLTVDCGEALALCGEAFAEAGEPEALCGNYFTYREVLRNYIVPLDPAKWPYFLYIGAEVFGSIAQVEFSRKDEFEDLCLKICPSQQWLGILVEYE